MKSFEYVMPTKLFVGRECLKKNYRELGGYGKKAFIVTGKSSRYNGSLLNCTEALEANAVEYLIYDKIKENPSVEEVEAAAKEGNKNGVDFVIGIGGGSPMDAAKAIGILIKNKDKTGEDLCKLPLLSSVPLIAVPTTAGTGSETTPYSILTIHKKKTKQSLPHKIFFDKAFIDARYAFDMPRNITTNTAVDALTHLIESYLCTNANYFSDKLCETGFSMFAECRKALYDFTLDFDLREKLFLMSSMGGFCISQTGTSLPHKLGYALTYFKNVAHGAANGVLTAEYIKLCDPAKVSHMLSILGFSTIDELDRYIRDILELDFSLSQKDIEAFSKEFYDDKSKQTVHPFNLSYEDVVNVYSSSMKR